MKKVPLLFLSIAAVLMALTLGFYVIRNLGSGVVRVSILPCPIVTVPKDTIPESTIAYPININTADVSILMTLPGIGETYAKRIVDYRTAHGSFRSVGELLNVEGIGEKRLEAILDLITTGGNHENSGSR